MIPEIPSLPDGSCLQKAIGGSRLHGKEEEECHTYTFHMFPLEEPCAERHGHLRAQRGRIVAPCGTVISEPLN
jgi:hypothetical protein